MARRLGSAALAVALATVAGCAHLGSRGPDPTDPADLYPLSPGRSWTFQVTRPGVAGHGTTVTRVASVKGHTVHMRSGTHAYDFTVRKGGLYRPAQDAWLLKGPVTLGATWRAPLGGTTKVTAVGRTVTVPAGTFHDCVVVDERVPAAQIRQVHTFCPGVGPVKLTQFSDGALIARGVLMAYGRGGHAAR